MPVFTNNPAHHATTLPAEPPALHASRFPAGAPQRNEFTPVKVDPNIDKFGNWGANVETRKTPGELAQASHPGGVNNTTIINNYGNNRNNEHHNGGTSVVIGNGIFGIHTGGFSLLLGGAPAPIYNGSCYDRIIPGQGVFVPGAYGGPGYVARPVIVEPVVVQPGVQYQQPPGQVVQSAAPAQAQTQAPAPAPQVQLSLEQQVHNAYRTQNILDYRVTELESLANKASNKNPTDYKQELLNMRQVPTADQLNSNPKLLEEWSDRLAKDKVDPAQKTIVKNGVQAEKDFFVKINSDPTLTPDQRNGLMIAKLNEIQGIAPNNDPTKGPVTQGNPGTLGTASDRMNAAAGSLINTKFGDNADAFDAAIGNHIRGLSGIQANYYDREVNAAFNPPVSKALNN